MDKILLKEYGLKLDTRIQVFHTKWSSKPGFKNYRTKFRLYYLGAVSGLRKHIDDIAKKQRKKRKLERQS
jgi:hypothetical protein